MLIRIFNMMIPTCLPKLEIAAVTEIWKNCPLLQIKMENYKYKTLRGDPILRMMDR